jgi:hypothetical protein
MSLVDGRKAVFPDILVDWLTLVSAVIASFAARKNSRDTIPIPDLIGDQSGLLQIRYYARGLCARSDASATRSFWGGSLSLRLFLVDVAPRANGKDDHHVLLGI